MTDLSSLFPQGVGNLTADNDISDNTLISGDGGTKVCDVSTTYTLFKEQIYRLSFDNVNKKKNKFK